MKTLKIPYWENLLISNFQLIGRVEHFLKIIFLLLFFSGSVMNQVREDLQYHILS